MRHYFEPQSQLNEYTYYERYENPDSIVKSELYVRSVAPEDVDVLASEFRFVEWIYDRRSGYNFPILERL